MQLADQRRRPGIKLNATVSLTNSAIFVGVDIIASFERSGKRRGIREIAQIPSRSAPTD